MQIEITTTEELGNYEYTKVFAGVYVCETETGQSRVLICQADESAMLIFPPCQGFDLERLINRDLNRA